MKSCMDKVPVGRLVWRVSVVGTSETHQPACPAFIWHKDKTQNAKKKKLQLTIQLLAGTLSYSPHLLLSAWPPPHVAPRHPPPPVSAPTACCRPTVPPAGRGHGQRRWCGGTAGSPRWGGCPAPAKWSPGTAGRMCVCSGEAVGSARSACRPRGTRYIRPPRTGPWWKWGGKNESRSWNQWQMSQGCLVFLFSLHLVFNDPSLILTCSQNVERLLMSRTFSFHVCIKNI